VALEEAGGVRIDPRPRRRWLRPPLATLVPHPDVDRVIAEEADWSEPAFSLDPERGERLARTVEVLGAQLPAGWSLRAYWVGDPEEGEQPVTAAELADLTRASRLERGVRYRVVA
jgi:hypothetical protein